MAEKTWKATKISTVGFLGTAHTIMMKAMTVLTMTMS